MAKSAPEEKKPSIHAGHRERIRERLRTAGLEAFSEHEALELLLTFAIPQRDVNPLAHELINTFGSLKGVFSADESELLRVKGMGRNAAVLIVMMPQLMRYMRMKDMGERPVIVNLLDAKAYCTPLFVGAAQEQIYMVCLDQAGHVLHRMLLHTGVVDQVSLHPRTVVEAALRHKAYSVILAHNHPGGTAVPSQADIEMTKKISSALYMIGIHLVDHLIFAGRQAYSMNHACVWEDGAGDASYVRAKKSPQKNTLKEEGYEWIALVPADDEGDGH